jgi:hypothetical protein
MCQMPSEDVVRRMADELLLFRVNLNDQSAVIMRLMTRFNPLMILKHCAEAVEVAQSRIACAANKICDELRQP